MCRVIIAGHRGLSDYERLSASVRFVFERRYSPSLWSRSPEVVSGTCRGADLLGERFAADHGLPCSRFPADWARYGRSAGPLRNRQMAEYALQSPDGLAVLIAFLVPGSRGTASMVRIARELGLDVFVVHVPPDPA